MPRRQSLISHARRAANRLGWDITRYHFKSRFLAAVQQRGITCVLDIGANEGQYGELLRAGGFSGTILSVEPLAEPYVELSRVAARDGQWTAVHAAIAAEPGEIVMNVSGNSVSSSALPLAEEFISAEPSVQYVSTETVPATTVDELVHQYDIDPAHTLLKLDVQGFEPIALDGATKTLPQFAAAQLELSLAPVYEGQQLIADLIQRMDRAGFDLWQLEPGFIDQRTQRQLQADGLFLRRVG